MNNGVSATEYNLMGVTGDLEAAMSELNSAVCVIEERGGLPDCIDNNSPLVNHLKRAREAAKRILYITKKIEKEIMAIETGSTLEIEPCQETSNQADWERFSRNCDDDFSL